MQGSLHDNTGEGGIGAARDVVCSNRYGRVWNQMCQVLQKRMQAAAAMGCQGTQQWSDLKKAASMCLHC